MSFRKRLELPIYSQLLQDNFEEEKKEVKLATMAFSLLSPDIVF